MLNNLSVLDIAAFLIRKTKRFLSVVVISGLLFAVARYGVVYSRRSSSLQQVMEKKELADEKKSAYEQYIERIGSTPAGEIDPEETCITTVIYYSDGVETTEETTDQDQSFTGFCELLIAGWKAEDISVAVKDCYAVSIDDNDVRSVADLSLDTDSIITLTVKSKDETEGIDVTERLCRSIGETIDRIAAETGSSFRLAHTNPVSKQVYDEEIEAIQKETKKKASDYEKEYIDALNAYEELSLRTDPSREACRWGIIGALIAFILVFSYYVCVACLFEPALSAEQISRKTGLRFIGSLRDSGILNSISSRLNRDPLWSDRNAGFDNLLYQTKEICGDENELLAVCFGTLSDNEKKRRFSSNLIEKGTELLERDGSDNLEELGETMKKHIRSIFIVREDEVSISDLNRVRELSEKYGCHIEGFIVS